MTKFLNISTDTTLGGNAPSDELAVSQKAIKTYVDTKQDTLTAGTGIDITNNTVSVTAPTVINTATGDGVLTILGTPTSAQDAMNIGKGTSVSGSYSFCVGLNSSATGASAFCIGRSAKAVGSASMAMGLSAETNGQYAVAIGRLAKANANNTIQIGYGTNTTAYTLGIGFYGNSSTYTLLDGTTGLIPTARLADTTSATQGQVLTLDSSLNAVWANGGGGGAVDSVNGQTGVVVLTATDVGALPDSTVIPDAQIQSDWNQADNTKVDYIKNKPTIPTVGNGTITITQGGVSKGTFTTNQSGNTTIALDSGGGSVAIDNITITKNLSDEIQTVAVIDQNSGSDKIWTGDSDGYEAIASPDSDTFYAVTDDIGAPATVIAELAEGLNDKVDIGHQVIAFQEPTAANNYTWYRKYADGWVEQGGVLSYSHTSGTTTNWEATFVVPMADTNFTASSVHRCPFTLEMKSSPENIGTTRIQGFLQGNHTQTVYIYWVVYGMAA